MGRQFLTVLLDCLLARFLLLKRGVLRTRPRGDWWWIIWLRRGGVRWLVLLPAPHLHVQLRCDDLCGRYMRLSTHSLHPTPPPVHRTCPPTLLNLLLLLLLLSHIGPRSADGQRSKSNHPNCSCPCRRDPARLRARAQLQSPSAGIREIYGQQGMTPIRALWTLTRAACTRGGSSPLRRRRRPACGL